VYDITIKNGTIINGTGSALCTDIAVKNGRIVRVGNIRERGVQDIDASGKTVSPGFIDFHSHNGRVILQKKPFLSKITQGITTEVVGNCGFCGVDSPGEGGKEGIENDIKTVLGACPEGMGPLSWKGYLDLLASTPLLTNIIPLAGHNNIRTSVMGVANRPAEKPEMERMEVLTAEIMEAGYRGFSTGLIYPPGIFTPGEEIVKIATVVSRYGGMYTTHIRGEAETLLPAIEEALSVGRESGVSLQVSHLKTLGKSNWDKADDALDIINRAREEGIDVNYDQYPYTAGSTTAAVLLPPWMLEGGQEKTLQRLSDKNARERAAKDIKNGIAGWQNLLLYGPETVVISRVKTSKNRRCEGKTLLEIAKEEGKEYTSALFDLLREEGCDVLMIVFFTCEASIRKLLRERAGFVGTDGIPCRHPHPRLWGTFPRILSKYVREEKVLSLDDAVYKFSRGPAGKLGLARRGEIKEGNIADIVVFDGEKVEDAATFENPEKRAKGIEYVIINGKTTIRKGRFNGVTAGRLLKKGEE